MVLTRFQTFLDARFDFGNDGFRVFRAGVIRRDDRDIGQFGADAAHDGALGLIAVAAAAKDGDDAVRLHGPRRFQSLLQAVRRMGIVDDDGEILTGFDEFKTARYGVKGLDSLVDSGFIDAFGMGCADGSQRIVDIEQARDIHVEVDVDEGADDIKGGFLQFDFQVGPFEVGILFDTVGQDLAVAGLEDILGPGIVDIDDSRLVFLDVVGSGQALEELGLGGDVVFHGLVEIEVVLGQVGEDSRIVFDAGDAVQGLGMAGNFHDDMGHALFLHEGQEVLEFDDIRRRVVDRQFFIVDEGVDGADDADMIACSPQDMGDDVSRRRLAVSAGDADHAHLLARIIIKERDYVFQGVMDVRYLDLDSALGQVEVFRRQDGDGPFFDSLGCKGGAIDVDTGNADEEIARFNLARIR